MNEVKVFNNAEFGSVRSLMVDGEPYFVGKDVAEALGYADLNKAVAMHVDEEDKLNDKTASSLGQRGGWLINESGLYSLILSSKLPSARKFKRWVTSEVLPEIRRTGSFDAAGKHGVITKEDCLRAAEALSSCTDAQLPCVAAVLRQAGFSVPASVGAPRPSLPAVAHPEARGTYAGLADRERMQYEAALQYPQLILERPDLMAKYPEIAAVARGLKDGGQPRKGYIPWFNYRKLRRELDARGMGPGELSRRSGVHERTLRKYLAGESRPAEANRGAICAALGVVGWYFDR